MNRSGSNSIKQVPSSSRAIRSTLWSWAWTGILAFGAARCGVAQESGAALDRYGLGRSPTLHEELPEELEEVSGLAFSDEGRLFANEDERAFIYELDPLTGAALSRFYLGSRGVRGDFEGIAIAGDRFFLVDSDGTLLEFTQGERDGRVDYETIRTGLGDRCEVEGLAFDERTNALLLACKTARRRELRDHIAVFAVPLDRMVLEAAPRLFVSFEALGSAGGEGVSPSGIEVDRATGNFVLIAAQQRLILEIEREGSLRGVERLSREHHRQSEGLAIGEDGALFIADEADGEEATLSRYPVSLN